MIKVLLSSKASAQEMAVAIACDSNEEDIFELIRHLDDQVCDTDFTEKLYLHFKKLHKQYLREQV